jgi:hypothetical protein
MIPTTVENDIERIEAYFIVFVYGKSRINVQLVQTMCNVNIFNRYSRLTENEKKKYLF